MRPIRNNSSPEATFMGEITHFVAMPFDLTSDGLVAGEP
jgi:hypothetical protein